MSGHGGADDVPPGYYGSALPFVGDWAGMVGFNPALYHAPADLDALQAVLDQIARDPAAKIRVVGGLHSCSQIFAGETIVDLSRIPLEFECTPDGAGGGTVVASAHMHVHEFLWRAAKLDLSLTATGGTDAQTLAGLISTNTAGATARTTIYETLSWVEYLAPCPDRGGVQRHRVSREDSQFSGMIASLGAIGVLTRVCFALVKQRFFTTITRVLPPQDVLGDIAATNARYDFWRIQWLPRNDQACQLWAATLNTGPLLGDADYPADTAEELASSLMEIAAKLGAGYTLDPIVKELYDRLAANYTDTRDSGPLRLMIPVDRNAPLRVAMAEWCFAPADVPRTMQVCRDYWDANGWPNLATEIECTKTDDYWMSAWNWPGLDYIVKFNFQYLTSFLGDADKAGLVQHLKGLWDALDAAQIPFKAHWGKINFLDAARIAKLYQPDRFVPLVWRQLVNPYLAERLPGLA